jgi:hypothetical protein
MLPGSIDACDQRAGQHQLVVRTSDDLPLAFGLLSRAQTRLVAEQHLLVKPIAMFLRVAQSIGRADLGQGGSFLAPTDPGITATVAGSITDHLDHADLDLAGVAQM